MDVSLIILLLFTINVSSYWLMGANNILTTQRLDPVVSPGTVSTHVHSVLGGSNFGLYISTAVLRQSTCTSIPLNEDKSNYWFPHLYWQWLDSLSHFATRKNDGTFVAVNGNYLFSDQPHSTTAFPDDFRMISGDPTLRTLDPSSFAQQAVTFLCLDFSGKSSKYNELPVRISCPSGIRAQINFPSCWDGVNTDSMDHKSHVSFLSTGPDNGTCSDPSFPVTLPRIFMEMYWNTEVFEGQRKDAMTPSQPFVQVLLYFTGYTCLNDRRFSNGDPTGYGYHADFINGWDQGVLQRAIDGCNCNPYGDPSCCVAAGIFTMQQTIGCYSTPTFDEAVTGNLTTLPGANPVQAPCYEAYVDPVVPPILSPVFAFTSTAGATPTIPTGNVVTGAQTLAAIAQSPAGTCIRKGLGLSVKFSADAARSARVAIFVLLFVFSL
ncbi:hypothetical protein C8J56DRAFT_788645 [Mycena floridula]|nr:hypothetical protein C8J56DRAFT_788645 [Mycena floridula]